MRYILPLLFISCLCATEITYKRFIDVDNPLITNVGDPLYLQYHFNSTPDNYGEAFLDLNTNAQYDKRAVIEIYSREKDLSDGVLDGKDGGLPANLFIEVDEFSPRSSLQKYISSSNLSMSPNILDHFIDSTIINWDLKVDGSYNGDFSLRTINTQTNTVSTTFTDNVLTYNPQTIVYTTLSNDYDCYYLKSIPGPLGYQLSSVRAKTILVNEPSIDLGTIIINTTNTNPPTIVGGAPPNTGGGGGGCLLR